MKTSCIFPGCNKASPNTYLLQRRRKRRRRKERKKKKTFNGPILPTG